MSSRYERAQQAAAQTPLLVRWEYDDAECARIVAERLAVARRTTRSDAGCLLTTGLLAGGLLFILFLLQRRNLTPQAALLLLGFITLVVVAMYLPDIIRAWLAYRRTRRGCAMSSPMSRRVIIDPLTIRQTGTYLLTAEDAWGTPGRAADVIRLFSTSLELVTVAVLPGDPAYLWFQVYQPLSARLKMGRHTQYKVPIPQGHEAEADNLVRWFRREILLQPEDGAWD